MSQALNHLNSLVGLFVPSAAMDVVGVFDKDFKQVFQRARPMKAMINEDSKLMDHPVESGAMMTDHRIILPIEIELSLILQAEDYRDTYQEIKQLYGKAELLIIQTLSGVYNNFLIKSLPHDEDPERSNTLAIACKLKQVELIIPEMGTLTPKNKTKTKTVDKGTVQAAPVTEEKETAALKAFGGYFK